MPKKSTTNPYFISREPHDLRAYELNEYAYFAGVVIWAWNELQTQYQHLFACIVDKSNHNIGIAAWNTLNSDQAQRDMLEAALRQALYAKEEKRALSNLLWAIRNTKFLAPYRNYAAHLPVELEVTIKKNKLKHKVIPNERAARAAPARVVSNVGYQRLYRLMVGDLAALEQYVGAHATELFGRVSTGTLPLRPRMRVHRVVQEKLRELAPQKPPKRSKRKAYKSKTDDK